MKSVATLLLIATAHVAFLFGAYGSAFFGLAHLLPYGVIVLLWLGASSCLAIFGYFKAASRLVVPVYGRAALSVASVLASLYVGVTLAFNTYGT